MIRSVWLGLKSIPRCLILSWLLLSHLPPVCHGRSAGWALKWQDSLEGKEEGVRLLSLLSLPGEAAMVSHSCSFETNQNSSSVLSHYPNTKGKDMLFTKISWHQTYWIPFFFPLGIAFWVLTFRGHLLSPLFGRDGGRAVWWVSRGWLTLSQPSTASSVMVLFVEDTQSLAACCPSAELVLHTSFYYSECYWINYIKTTSPVTLRKSYFQQRIFLHLCSDLMNACTLSLFSYCFTFLHACPWWELIISLIVCRNIYALRFLEHYCTRYL